MQLLLIFASIVALAWLLRLIDLVAKQRWFAAAFLAFALVWSLNALVALHVFRTSTVNADGVLRNPRVEFLYLLGLLLLPLIARRKFTAVLIAHRLMALLCVAWGYLFVVNSAASIGQHTLLLALILTVHVLLTAVAYQPLSRRRARQAIEATFE